MSIIAIQKLQGEMDKDKADGMLQDVGKFLIDHIIKNPMDAEKILIADKTIIKGIDAMSTFAKTKQKNGRAGLTYAEGTSIVLKYYGIEGREQEAVPAASKKIELDDLF